MIAYVFTIVWLCIIWIIGVMLQETIIFCKFCGLVDCFGAAVGGVMVHIDAAMLLQHLNAKIVVFLSVFINTVIVYVTLDSVEHCLTRSLRPGIFRRVRQQLMTVVVVIGVVVVAVVDVIFRYRQVRIEHHVIAVSGSQVAGCYVLRLVTLSRAIESDTNQET